MNNIKKWHEHFNNPSKESLSALLAEDCCFYSPVVFTPQKGKAITMQYLLAAGTSLGDSKNKPKSESKFRYTREIVDGDNAMLEFETEIDGKYVNGIDIIHFNEEGLIDELKVMIRPLQAVNAVWESMGATLQANSEKAANES
ncbi:MAG: nuclear transport factor 2 family protein [Alphaproteobacteria bacterium]|nr:nuclear transport factor 2 family protein [Alphaproteobacteria bacterium]